MRPREAWPSCTHQLPSASFSNLNSELPTGMCCCSSCCLAPADWLLPVRPREAWPSFVQLHSVLLAVSCRKTGACTAAAAWLLQTKILCVPGWAQLPALVNVHSDGEANSRPAMGCGEACHSAAAAAAGPRSTSADRHTTACDLEADLCGDKRVAEQEAAEAGCGVLYRLGRLAMERVNFQT